MNCNYVFKILFCYFKVEKLSYMKYRKSLGKKIIIYISYRGGRKCYIRDFRFNLGIFMLIECIY